MKNYDQRSFLRPNSDPSEGNRSGMTKNATDSRRKWFAGVSIAVVAALAALLTVFIWRWLDSFSQEGFRDYIQSFGLLGPLVLLGIQVLQIFIALIPGELVESAAGFAFGPLWGTVICYAGIAIASSAVFLLTRKFGVKLVEVFVSRQKINNLRFLNTEAKRNTLIFLMFLIPGTPKDLLTYFAGLTDIKLGSFLIISLLARIPSVVSSTFGGHMLGNENYLGAALLYAITGALSIGGMLIYRHYLRRKNR